MYVLLNSFPCESASWWVHAGVVPAHGVAIDTSLQGLNLFRIPSYIQGTSSQALLLAMCLMVSVNLNFEPSEKDLIPSRRKLYK